MDAVGLQQAYLLGNSLGCHTVAAMTAQHRERVAGTILVSPVGDPGGLNVLRLAARALNDFIREPGSLWIIMLQDFMKAGARRTVLTLRSLLELGDGWQKVEVKSFKVEPVTADQEIS